MIENLLVLWLAAFPLMGSPGPATLSLAAIGAAYGARAGLAYWTGIVAGTFVVLVVIASGLTGLVLAVPVVRTAVVVAAAAYILYLAVRIATAPPLSGRGPEARAPSLPGGFALAVANPKAFAAIGAVYAGSTVVAGDLVLDAAAKIAALGVVVVVVNIAWLLFGSAVSAVLADPRAGRGANVVFAVLLVASVAAALL